MHYWSHSDLINKNLCEKSEKKRIFCRIGHFPTVPSSTSRFRYLEKQQLFDLPLPRCLAPTALTPCLWPTGFCDQHYPAKGSCQAFQKNMEWPYPSSQCTVQKQSVPPFSQMWEKQLFSGWHSKQQWRQGLTQILHPHQQPVIQGILDLVMHDSVDARPAACEESLNHWLPRWAGRLQASFHMCWYQAEDLRRQCHAMVKLAQSLSGGHSHRILLASFPITQNSPVFSP